MRRSSASCALASFFNAVALTLIAACSRDSSGVAANRSSPVVSASSSLPPGVSAARLASATPDAGVDPLAAFATAQAISGKPVGHTSLVFKLKLEGGLVAAYKPRSRKPLGTHRYKGEIAAYRIARALGLRNVPPALARAFDAKAVRAALAASGGTAAWDADALPGDDGQVHGALIPWIEGLEFSPIDHGTERTKWETWLLQDGAVIADEDRALAAQISTMLVFDYVTANWDRWSGGNIGFDAATGTLLFIDNDGAFYDTPNRADLDAQLARIARVRRFSKSFVTALRALDAEKLATVVGEETPGAPLLSGKTLAFADERRRRALDVIDDAVARWGPSVMLFE